MIQRHQFALTEKLAEDTRTLIYRGRRAAERATILIKILKSEYPDRKEIARLQHEYDILKTLELDGVIRALGLEPFGHGQVLLMEDFDGRLLSELMAREKLALANTLRIAISVARALHSLHSRRIVHKALHPRHILCDPQTAKTKLIGFEIARRLGSDGHCGEEEAEGMPAYLSPEQTGRTDLEIDERADLYSLGVTLYEMLAGMLPFQSDNPVELVHSHIARIPVPPHHHAGDIPVALSSVVMKLLAKTPRDRYQHADAVAADLQVCLAQWEAQGSIEPFVLGAGDSGDTLSIPQKLYGREPQVDALFAALERVRRGRSELFLVAGGAGLGKSVLIQELSKEAVRLGDRFIAGKFDPLNRGVPFASFCQAFRDLARRLLAEPPARLAEWKAKILAAVGSKGQLLIDLIPELGLVLGPQPPAVPLGPMETQNRFALLLQDFVRLFCDPSRPLVLFLDDLQWADPASLSLLRILFSDSGSRHLLVVGAYRDSEVGEAHPLRTVLGELRTEGVPLVEITLDPLDLPNVRRLLAETLNTSGPRLDSLAAQIFAKTHGNPFFLTQLIHALHSARLLHFDRQQGQWSWDSAAIASAPITDDVADFMVGRLRKLAAGTQKLLALAACIGHQFDLSMLAAIAERSPGETAAELGEALRETLVTTHHAGDRFLPSPAPSEISGTAAAGAVAAYRFLHDRVQQAAYALIDADTKQDVHLRIGRRLRDKLAGASSSELLFEAMHHLNVGAARIAAPDERAELARLNLRAGQVAKASTAYAAASGFFQAGISLLGETSWTADHELTFLLHRERAECDHLSGEFEKACAELDHLQTHAGSDVQRADIFGMRLRLYLSQSLHGRGIEAGRRGLALLGVHLPDSPDLYEEAFRQESSGIEQILAVRSLESLIDAPLVTDPDHETLLKLLGSLGVLAYMGEPRLGLLVMAKHVHLSLTRGQSRFSIWGYAFYGFVLASLEQYSLGFRFTRLAAQLAQKYHTVDVECNVYMQLGSCGPYCEPLRLSLGYLARAQRVGLETGDHFFASLAFLYFPTMQFRLGQPLDTVRVEVDRSFAVMQRTKDVMCTIWLTALRQAIDRLQGSHGGRAVWNGEPLEEPEWVARLAGQFIGLSCFYHVFRLQFAVLHEDYNGALAEIGPIEERIVHILNIHWTTEFPLYASLTLTALYPTATPEEQPRLLETVERHRRRLARLAELCPANELHRQRLVDAEVARISSNAAEAMKLYDESIALAREHGFPHHEALANELCAKFHLANGRDRVARAYMIEARYGYERWGATTKVKQLEEKYFDLLFQDSAPKEDVAAVMQATQAIAGEIVLDQLLNRFMRIVVANAGAQRGSLILERGDRLTIDATLILDPDTVTVGQAEPLEGSSSLPAAVVFYVERTRESLVVNLPREDPRFAGDPYIIAHEPKSILCLSLMHRGHLVGIIYLEHRILNHAFPPARVQFLKLMSSQVAVAIENALLYAHLEAQVSARTQDLRAANDQLHATNERLQIEMAERERLQQAHARMQEETIRLQNSMLLELSTPIIPISDHIMVMPIVGAIDERRARQILEVSLQGVQASQPKVVIIDITGVRVVDPDVATTLMRIAGALRLLGTETVVTGIRSAVAQTLIALGINLQSVETRTNLKMGIAYALSRTGEARVFR
jgi:predicted ATPase/GAF domain-containing protein/anti-anti-sigma regulatory factor